MEETVLLAARRALEEPSPRPLYLRLADGLEGHLRRAAAPLPSARQLAAASGIGRATVTAAYRELARRRLIHLKVGRPPRSPVKRPPAPAPASASQGPVDLARYAPDAELLPPGAVFRWLGAPAGAGEGEAVAQYGDACGFRPLREWVSEHLRRLGLAAPPQQVVLTAGVQHGLDLLLRAFTRPGDAAVVEDPTYPGLPPLLATHRLRAVGVPAVHAPADPAALLAAVRTHRARLAVVTPTLHNPTGLVMDRAAREYLACHAPDAVPILVEEFFDPALVGEGEAPPPLGAFTPRVVTLGSFSKSLFPGLRVGWLTGPPEVVAAVVAVKRATDLSGSPFLEAAAWTLCTQGVLEAQVERLRRVALQRRDQVLAGLRGLPPEVRCTRPAGGFSLLLALGAGRSARQLAACAARRGVWVLPGPAMSVSGRDDLLRVAYAAVGGAALEAAVAKLVQAFAPGEGDPPLV